MPEIVYVLTKISMPGYVKIGRTTDSVQNRMANLSSSSGVPLPFECYFAAEVKDCSKLEKILHQLFADARVNPKREFFEVDPEKVVLAISIGEFQEVTPGIMAIEPEEKLALEQAQARRKKIKLAAIDIHPGSVLNFSRDESIIATVIDGNKVLYEGESLSLSGAAIKALQRLGYKTLTASGSEYWIYEEELLDERRNAPRSWTGELAAGVCQALPKGCSGTGFGRAQA
ncbi:MAG: GIY-YIG nuclease family protein [Limnohabitans sp.]